MSFASARQGVASHFTTALTDLGVKVYPVLPNPLREGSGWVALTQGSSEDATFGSLRASYTISVAIGVDVYEAQTKLDELVGPMMDAAFSFGGWAVTFTPISLYFNGTDYFCASVTLFCDVEAD